MWGTYPLFIVLFCDLPRALGYGDRVRCYDCNYDPMSLSRTADGDGEGVIRRGFDRCALTDDDDEKFVDSWPCRSRKCFIRRDPDGLVYRGCADRWNLPWGLDTTVNCTAQGQKSCVWWFCTGDLCNREEFGQGQVCPGIEPVDKPKPQPYDKDPVKSKAYTPTRTLKPVQGRYDTELGKKTNAKKRPSKKTNHKTAIKETIYGFQPKPTPKPEVNDQTNFGSTGFDVSKYGRVPFKSLPDSSELPEDDKIKVHTKQDNGAGNHGDFLGKRNGHLQFPYYPVWTEASETYTQERNNRPNYFPYQPSVPGRYQRRMDPNMRNWYPTKTSQTPTTSNSVCGGCDNLKGKSNDVSPYRKGTWNWPSPFPLKGYTYGVYYPQSLHEDFHGAQTLYPGKISKDSKSWKESSQDQEVDHSETSDLTTESVKSWGTDEFEYEDKKGQKSDKVAQVVSTMKSEKYESRPKSSETQPNIQHLTPEINWPRKPDYSRGYWDELRSAEKTWKEANKMSTKSWRDDSVKYAPTPEPTSIEITTTDGSPKPEPETEPDSRAEPLNEASSAADANDVEYVHGKSQLSDSEYAYYYYYDDEEDKEAETPVSSDDAQNEKVDWNVENKLYGDGEDEDLYNYADPCDRKCKGNPSALFPHPSRKNWFIQCGHGIRNRRPCTCCQPYLLRCPEGTSFDIDSHVCSQEVSHNPFQQRKYYRPVY